MRLSDILLLGNFLTVIVPYVNFGVVLICTLLMKKKIKQKKTTTLY